MWDGGFGNRKVEVETPFLGGRRGRQGGDLLAIAHMEKERLQ